MILFSQINIIIYKYSYILFEIYTFIFAYCITYYKSSFITFIKIIYYLTGLYSFT